MIGRPPRGGTAIVKSLEVLDFSLLVFQPLPLIALVVLVFSSLGWVTGVAHGCSHGRGARLCSPSLSASQQRGHQKVKGIICICEAKAAAHICICHMVNVP